MPDFPPAQLQEAAPGLPETKRRLLCRECLMPLLIWTTLVGLSLFYSLQQLQESSLELTKTQGREVFRLVEAMRVWNAEHGGIYVRQSERDLPNPYLDASIRATRTITGAPLTLLNPAYMTRQISGVIEREAGIRLHLTSLKPLNPVNQADPWEMLALQDFERTKLTEKIQLDTRTEQSTARYMAPLYVKQPCLSCHEKQGYKLGDVRGGLSVQWSAKPIVLAMNTEYRRTIAAHGAVWLLISIMIFLAVRQLLNSLSTIRQSQEALLALNSELENTVKARTRQLRESMHTLKTISQHAPGIVYQYLLRPGGDTAIPYANDQFFDLFGLRPEELRDNAARLYECLHPDDVAGFIASTQRSARNLTPWQHEFRIRDAQGRERWLFGDTMPQQQENGLILWNGFITDISLRKQAEIQLRQHKIIIDAAQDGFWMADSTGRLQEVNQAYAQMTGYSSKELLGMQLSELEAPPASLRNHLDNLSKTGHDVFETRLRHKAGHIFDIEISATGQQEAQRYFAFCRDISKRKQSERELQEMSRLLDETQHLSKLGGWKYDAATGRVTWTDEVYRIHGVTHDYDPGEAQHDIEFYAPSDRQTIAHAFERAVLYGEPYDLELSLTRQNGEKIWVRTIGKPIIEQGNIVGVSGNIADISDIRRALDALRESEMRFRQLADYDVLTKLPNRRLLTDRLTAAMAASKRNNCYGAVLFLDLDNFKPLNDQHGHDAGDLLLMEVATRLKSCVREVDTVARLGGDEFVVVLAELDQDQQRSREHAALIAEKIRSQLALPYLLPLHNDHNGVEHQCSASVGLVLFINHEQSQADIFRWADEAMYQAKKAGRNQIYIYENPATGETQATGIPEEPQN